MFYKNTFGLSYTRASRNNWNRKQKFSFTVKIFVFVTLLSYYLWCGLRSLWLCPQLSVMLCCVMLYWI